MLGVHSVVGDRLEATDSYGVWCNAKVVAVKGEGDERRVKVHYVGWNASFDEWVPVGTGRLGLMGASTSREPRAIAEQVTPSTLVEAASSPGTSASAQHSAPSWLQAPWDMEEVADDEEEEVTLVAAMVVQTTHECDGDGEGTCLGLPCTFLGKPCSRPDNAKVGRGWAYTACCEKPAHWECMLRWLNIHDDQQVESSRGMVDLNLVCPFCKAKLSRSSTRMMVTAPWDAECMHCTDEDEY